MKKIVILITLSFLSIGTISCKNLTDKISGKDSSSKVNNPFDTNSGNEANDIIGFHNKVVQLDDYHRDVIDNYKDGYTAMNDFIKNSISNPSGYSIGPVLISPVSSISFQKIESPSVLGNSYQELVNKMTSDIDALKKLFDELKTYKDAQDWKDDNGKKLEEINAKAQKLILDNRTNSEKLFAKLQPKTDESEIEILKDHPLKDEIVQSKAIMNLVDKIVADSYKTEDINAFKKNFEQQYAELEKLYNKNLKNEIPSEYSSEKVSFELYNKSVNDFLGKMRILQRELNTKGTISENLFVDLDNAQEHVLNSYNNFVD